MWHAHNKISVPCKTKQNFQTLLSMAVHCGEPKSRNTGRFVAPSYQIMAENPAISAEIGHAESPKIATDIRHGQYLNFDNTASKEPFLSLTLFCFSFSLF
jgi:hypothetical protein